MCMCKLLPVHYNMYRCLCKSVKDNTVLSCYM